jgi:hypothetical protein
MKKNLHTAAKFIQDNPAVLFAASAGLVVGATVMYVAAVKAIGSVQPVTAFAKVTDDNLTVIVKLSNGVAKAFDWPSTIK